ncbi:MAG: hypothetical protein WAW79_05910 [Steroidobacteraceae bacterium]
MAAELHGLLRSLAVKTDHRGAGTGSAQGAQWEAFLKTGESTVYGSGAMEGASAMGCREPPEVAQHE